MATKPVAASSSPGLFGGGDFMLGMICIRGHGMGFWGFVPPFGGTGFGDGVGGVGTHCAESTSRTRDTESRNENCSLTGEISACQEPRKECLDVRGVSFIYLDFRRRLQGSVTARSAACIWAAANPYWARSVSYEISRVGKGCGA